MPGHLAGQALSRVHRRLVAEMLTGAADVRTRVPLIAGSGGLAGDRRWSTDGLGDELDRLVEGDGVTTPDVVDASDRAVLEGQHGASHRVVDVGVRAGLLAVAVDGDGLPVEHRLDEAVVGHIRTLARTVDGEVADDGALQTGGSHMRQHELLGRQLRDAVWRGRLEGAL